MAAPVISTVTPATGPSVGGNTVTLQGTFGGDEVSVKLNTVSATIVSQNTTFITITAGNGASNIGLGDVEVVSPSFGTGTKSNGYRYNVVPVINTVSPASGPRSGTNSVVITGTTDLGANSDIQSVTLNGVSATITAQTANSVTVTAADGAAAVGTGNVVVTSTSFGTATKSNAYTYNPAPGTPSATPDISRNSGGVTVTISGSSAFGASDITSVTLNGIAAVLGAQTATTVTVTTGDAAAASGSGNIVISSTSFGQSSGGTFTYRVKPALSSAAPSNGPAAGGSVVLITGSNQLGLGSDITSVTVNGVAATLSTQTTSSITVTTAASSPATGNVVVTSTSFGAATLSNGFTYNVVPAINNLVPNTGRYDGSNHVTINGVGFLGSGSDINSVTFAGTTANIQSQTTSSVVVAAPAGTGAVTVSVVSTSYGIASSVGAYTYSTAGTVSTVTPGTGPNSGNTIVTISGTNLGDGSDITSVTLDGVAATIQAGTQTSGSVTVTSASGLSAAGTNNVVVVSTTRGSSTKASSWTYNVAPAINTVVPSVGPLAGGQVVTITGSTNLGTGDIATVTIGGVSASITGQSSNTVTIQTAAGPGLEGIASSVVVTSPSFGTATLAGGYTYMAAPVISTVTPATGPSVGGNTVTLQGTFGGDEVSVKLNTVSATIVSQNTTFITITAGNGASKRGSSTKATAWTYNVLPVLTTVVPSAGPITGGTTVTISASNTLGSGDIVSVTLNGVTATITNQAAQSVTVTAGNPSGVSGTGTVQVTSTSYGVASLPNAFTYNAQPVISGVVPAGGTVNGGTRVTISASSALGTGADITRVSIGGFDATLVSQQANQVIVTTAVGTAGVGSATVYSTSFGSATSSNSFTYISVQSASSLNPAQYVESTAVSVTVTGSFMSSAFLACTFDGLAVTATYLTPTTMSCAVGAHTSGAYTLRVSNDGVSFSDLTFYFLAPGSASTSLAPSFGGGSVLITTRTVRTGGTVTCNFGSSSSTATYVQTSASALLYTVTCPIPAHAVGAATLSLADSGWTNTFSFTYFQEGSVTSATPSSALSVGGDAVTIAGTAFSNSGTLGCRFGTIAATAAFVSATRITCTTPAADAGAVTLYASNENIFVNSQTSTAFTFFDQLTPTSAATEGGQRITVIGSFVSSSDVYKCKFGTAVADATRASTTQLSCTAPAQSAGTYTVGISRNSGTDYVSAQPQLTMKAAGAITQPYGSTTGNYSITISGRDISTASGVKCNISGSIVDAVVDAAAGTVVCPVPPGTAGQVAVNVIGDGGTPYVYVFQYYDIPSVSSVTLGGLVLQNQPATLTGLLVTASSPSVVLELTLSCLAGRFALPANDSFPVYSSSSVHATATTGAEVSAVQTNSSYSLSITGSATAVNNAVSGAQYQPQTNFVGTDTLSVTVRNTAQPAFVSSTSSLAITITPVNQAPSFTASSTTITVAPLQPTVISNWASAISAGPINEALQVVSFTVAVTNAAMFSTLPSVSSSGTLSFTLSAAAGGVSLVSFTVTAVDNGGTANSGTDQSSPTTVNVVIQSTSSSILAVAIGAALGGAAGLFVCGLIGYCIWRRRDGHGPADAAEGDFAHQSVDNPQRRAVELNSVNTFGRFMRPHPVRRDSQIAMLDMDSSPDISRTNSVTEIDVRSTDDGYAEGFRRQASDDSMQPGIDHRQSVPSVGSQEPDSPPGTQSADEQRVQAKLLKAQRAQRQAEEEAAKREAAKKEAAAARKEQELIAARKKKADEEAARDEFAVEAGRLRVKSEHKQQQHDVQPTPNHHTMQQYGPPTDLLTVQQSSMSKSPVLTATKMTPSAVAPIFALATPPMMNLSQSVSPLPSPTRTTVIASTAKLSPPAHSPTSTSPNVQMSGSVSPRTPQMVSVSLTTTSPATGSTVPLHNRAIPSATMASASPRRGSVLDSPKRGSPFAISQQLTSPFSVSPPQALMPAALEVDYDFLTPPPPMPQPLQTPLTTASAPLMGSAATSTTTISPPRVPILQLGQGNTMTLATQLSSLSMLQMSNRSAPAVIDEPSNSSSDGDLGAAAEKKRPMSDSVLYRRGSTVLARQVYSSRVPGGTGRRSSVVVPETQPGRPAQTVLPFSGRSDGPAPLNVQSFLVSPRSQQASSSPPPAEEGEDEQQPVSSPEVPARRGWFAN
eukprot:TRINITY_DN5710_c0_g1_i4.p1 TRINITY_DN5710_c0_g1~~TRINITY_DN5710_c0_g1_i4.p1  ORF type:complete len:2265 (+),score=623.94 TRINITY_DN5710_c0_g1_i4:331-6795(+)